MKLICLGSSSKGNSYILQDSRGHSIVLECGVPIRELKKALDFDLSKVLGSFASHCHLDHSGRIGEYCKAGIDVWMEIQNQDHIDTSNHRVKLFREKDTLTLSGFKIRSFAVQHDVPTVGLLIEHEEMGRTVFLTDTQYCNYSFPGVSHFLVEANYCEKIMNERLISGSIQGYLRNRIQNSHMSLNTCKDFLTANDLSQCMTVVLLHLSESNSDESRFIREVHELTGKPTYAADAGRVFTLNRDPF